MTKDKEVKDVKDGKDSPVSPPDTRLFDVRTVERNIKRGSQSRKEYDKHLKALPDSKDKVRSGE